MEYDLYSNASKLLYMPGLPTGMGKIKSKRKALEWSQHISHFRSMQAFRDD